MKVTFFIALLCASLTSCSIWEYLSTPDNAVEEIGEAVLDHYTGLDIDFTPNSGQEKK